MDDINLIPESSPVPEKTVPNQLSFPDAIREIISGKRVTRVEWGNSNLYGLLRNSELMLHLIDGYHRWIVSEGDMYANDWIVVEPN